MRSSLRDGAEDGFSQDDTEVLVSLVQHHLLLADTATRRDIEDPATVAMVADKVGRHDVPRAARRPHAGRRQGHRPGGVESVEGRAAEALVAWVSAQLAGQPPLELPGPNEAEQAAEVADGVVGDAPRDRWASRN